MKKNFNIVAFAAQMAKLAAVKCGQKFSSKEITDLLKQNFTVKFSNEVLSNLENYGILKFSNFRTCQFNVESSWCTPENLNRVI